MGRTCNTHGEKWNVYRILVGKPELMGPLGRPRRKRKINGYEKN
jgi:hypothetical protein